MTAMAVLFALVLAAAATASSAGNTSVETLDRTPNGGYLKRPWPKGEPSFFYNFAGATSLADDFWSSGPWANGQPFNNGWDPGYLFFSSDGGLTLKLERKPFSDPGTSTGTGKRYDFTGGEVRSKDFYGYGTYSTCMRPAKVSGTSASFYIYNGPYDTPGDAGRWYNDHNEVDVEFIGKDTTKLQTNYFSRPKVPGANSGSGNEQLHDLGFDAADTWAAYAFRWSHGKIEWFVNGKHIRTATWKASNPVPLQSYSTCRVVANIWSVNKQAEEWAGEVDPHFQIATGHYRWMRYDQGSWDVPQSC